MKRLCTAILAAGALGMTACDQSATEERAENVEEAAEDRAENIEEQAENQAEAVEEAGENEAEAIRNTDAE